MTIIPSIYCGERIRVPFQASKESMRALAAEHGLNPKTVAKWRKRAATTDAPI